MGRKKLPRAVKQRSGTLRSNVPNGIEVPAGVPDKPRWLNQTASDVWDELAPITAELDLLSRNDQLTYGLLCDAVAVFLELREKFETADNSVCYSPKGGTYQNPLWGVMCRQREVIIRLAREFGMTPSARSGINVGGATQEDDPLDVLNARFGELMAASSN